jgi:hypothetical protein
MKLMARSLGIIVLVIALLAVLLATAPARLLGYLLPADQLVLQGFSGTVWRGSAARCLVQAGPGLLHLGAVDWELRPLSLLWLAPRLTLNSRWGGQTVTATLVLHGGEDVELYDLSANVPADLLRQFVPVALDGVLSLQLEQLELRDGLPIEGSGRLVWQNGTWLAPNGPVPLGSYALTFSQARGAALVGEILTLAGPVTAEGGVVLEQRNYKIDLLVEGEGSLDDRLRQALSLMARPVGSAYRMELDGDF